MRAQGNTKNANSPISKRNSCTIRRVDSQELVASLAEVQELQTRVVTTADSSARFAWAERIVVSPALGAKVSNMQVRIFIHAILEHLTKSILGIFSAPHSRRCHG
jgi:hypothetical protein